MRHGFKVATVDVFFTPNGYVCEVLDAAGNAYARGRQTHDYPVQAITDMAPMVDDMEDNRAERQHERQQADG